jgi:predicted amidohydrolase
VSSIRIALANLPFPATPEESIERAIAAIACAGRERAQIICFPECYVPGYRGLGHAPPPPDRDFLERAWAACAEAACAASVAVVLGTERLVDGALVATALPGGTSGSRTRSRSIRARTGPTRRARIAAFSPSAL